MVLRLLTRLRRDQRGFTLIEQLVVAGGLAVILSAILGLVEVSERLAPQTIERGRAVRDAQVGLDRMVRELRHTQGNVVASGGSVAADVVLRGRAYRVTYDCSGLMPGSTTLRACVRTEAGGTGGTTIVIGRVLNPSTVFGTVVQRSGIPAYIPVRVEVPSAGERKAGQAHKIVLQDGIQLRNTGAPTA